MQNIETGSSNFESCWHPTMHASERRQVVNQARCELCNEEFLPDSSGSTICSRSLCKEVRKYMQKQRRKKWTNFKRTRQLPARGRRSQAPVSLANPAMRIDIPFERSCDTKSIPCPVCDAPAGEQCPQGPNHIERGREARWERMGNAVQW